MLTVAEVDLIAAVFEVVTDLLAQVFVHDVLFWQPVVVVDLLQHDLVGVVVFVFVLLSLVVTVVLVVVDDCACTFTDAAKKNNVVRMTAVAKNNFFIFSFY